MSEPADRVRAVFGLTSDDPLPPADAPHLRAYHEHLRKNLALPFAAKAADPTNPFQKPRDRLRVTALLDYEECDADEGLLCEATRGAEQVVVPLADVRVSAFGLQRQLVEDYAYWFLGERIPVGGEWVPARELADYLLRDEEAVAPPRWWSLPVFFVLLGLGGAAYGAALGAAATASPVAAIAAGVGAVLGGLIVFLGGLLGRKSSDAEPLSPGRLNDVLVILTGALVGGLCGALLIAFVGSALGGIVGYAVVRLVQWLRRRRIDGQWGCLPGAVLGMVGWAWYWDAGAAGEGLLWGSVIGGGVAVGLGLLVIFILRLGGAGGRAGPE
jgi:hypothetical protein